MKVVFLDIDGVLVFYASEECRDGRLAVMDRAAVERLNRIVEATGAKVVISSSWRYNRSTERDPERVLRACGFRGEVVGRTTLDHFATAPGGVILTALSRTDEIRGWLAAHPEVMDHVALDDETLTLENHVQTEWTMGLQDEHAERAIAMLGERAQVAA